MTVAALPPGAVIGIVGGGQLGRMLAIAAARLGYRCHVLTPESDGPAAQVCPRVTVAGYDDVAALQGFAAAVDVVTFEFENVNAAGLAALAERRPIHPSPDALRTSQDRIAEKRFLADSGAPVAEWREVASPEALDLAIAAIGLPAILKTTRLGYDGRGQVRLTRAEDAAAAWAALEPKPLVLERVIDFACELSVIVARGADGMMTSFDVTENRHVDGILALSLAPARVSDEVAAAATVLARDIAVRLGLVGVLAVEMFLDRDQSLLVNEIAPRPHNSGHWTLEACLASQFEMQARAVAGLPLPPAARHSDAAMVNLIGPDGLASWPSVLATPGLVGHLYGKTSARPGRKMGHATRLFPRGGLPGDFGLQDALGSLFPEPT